MSRIETLFRERSKPVLSLFYTAGFPSVDTTTAIGKALSDAGVDMLEIGFPFSDSLVDGPTIQIANEKALEDGMTFVKYFDAIKSLRAESNVAIVSMCCLNPILQFGVEKYADSCKDSGIDGVLIADLPPEEIERDYKPIFDERGLDVILLVTGHSTEERLRYIDTVCSGFMYVVSSDAITGQELTVDEGRKAYFNKLKDLKLTNPLVVGFGISDKEKFDAAVEVADGAIIGSAFVRALSDSTDVVSTARDFAHMIQGRK